MQYGFCGSKEDQRSFRTKTKTSLDCQYLLSPLQIKGVQEIGALLRQKAKEIEQTLRS